VAEDAGMTIMLTNLSRQRPSVPGELVPGEADSMSAERNVPM